MRNSNMLTKLRVTGQNAKYLICMLTKIAEFGKPNATEPRIYNYSYVNREDFYECI